jgi:hypothetical protein
MSRLQRFLQAVLPRRWFAALERGSRAWMMQCPCGHERSVWDAGGIRYKAAGKPRRYARCPKCEQHTWHLVSWKEPAGTAPTA